MMHAHGDDGASFQDWLVRHRQTPAAIERFWKPILVSALSEDLDRIAVPYAAQVVRESMKSRNARTMGIPTVPLSHLYDAAKDYILARGGVVRLRSSVQLFCPQQAGVALRLQDSEEQFDNAVLALPFDQLSKLLPGSTESQAIREKIQHFETAPITGVHFWFDRQITKLPHAVLLDRTIQWMFHKSELLVRGNDAPKDANQGFRRASSIEPGAATRAEALQRSNATGERPSYVELVVSSSKSLIEKSRQEIIDLALRELREFFPAARDAKVVKATVIKELNATFSPTPGIDVHRPTQQTPWPSIVLAGDWTATGWPATMEGAVRSGYLAAEKIAGKSFLAPDLTPTGLMKVFGG
jgi:zeta-carotene desaturase